jgi:hypothetical protein
MSFLAAASIAARVVAASSSRSVSRRMERQYARFAFHSDDLQVGRHTSRRKHLDQVPDTRVTLVGRLIPRESRPSPPASKTSALRRQSRFAQASGSKTGATSKPTRSLLAVTATKRSARSAPREIACVVIDDDDLHAQLWEIDENLMRAELSPSERASCTARRKAIYEALHPEAKHRGRSEEGGIKSQSLRHEKACPLHR